MLRFGFGTRVVGPVLGGLALGAVVTGCGGSGGGSSVATPTPGSALSEGTLAKSSGMRIPPGPLVVLDLEKPGTTPLNDTDEVGTDRIPYRLEQDTRFTVEVKPEDELYITLISSATGRLVMDVGPDNPSFDADLPKGDYDLYIHSGQSSEDSIPVFARSEKVDGQTREAFGSWWKVNFARECRSCDMRGGFYAGNNWKGVNIEGADLTGANLTKVNMEGIKAARATFTGAKTAGLYVQGADFTDAIFKDTEARGIDFSNTTLIGMRAENANFSESKFVNADLSGASLKKSNLNDTDFTNARLNSASLEAASVSSANFKGIKAAHLYCVNATLQSVNFGAADLGGANFQYAIIIHGDFSGANLTSAGLYGATVRNSVFSRADMTRARLGSAGLYESTFEDTDLSGAELTNARLDGTYFARARMAGVQAQRAYAIGNTRFESVDARNIDLGSANFKDSTFNQTDLSKATANNMTVSNVTFMRSNLSQADFSRMVCKTVRFYDVDARGCLFKNLTGGPISFEYGTVYASSFSTLDGILFNKTQIL